MNKKGFAISIILYSLVFLVISIFYMLLGVVKTRYTVSSGLRESVIEELNSGNSLYNKVAKLGEDSAISYVQKYNISNGVPIDTPDGTDSKDVYYYTTTSSSRNSDAEQHSNVIFGNYCWQIIRTTADGGVKLVYNGPKTNDDKCPSDAAPNYSSNPRPSSIGVVGSNGAQKTTVSGNKLYGTSFEIFNDNGTNKFRLKNTFNANWNGDYDNDGNLDYPKIIGTFSCLNTSVTCTTLYYIGPYYSNVEASTTKYTLGETTHYSQIGVGSFNATYEMPESIGYMYNNDYRRYIRSFSESAITLISQTPVPSSSTAYYYGDAATWVDDHYELTMGGVTPTTATAWSSIRGSAKGLYTCRSTTNTSCSTVYYIVANSSSSYMDNFSLSNNENIDTKAKTWTVGTGYSESNGIYSLTGTKTLTIPLKDWFTNYNNSNYKNYYICDNLTSDTCTNEIYYAGETSHYEIKYNKVSNTYVFANDVEYVNGEYKLILNNPTKPYKNLWDWNKKYNTLSSTHYTCFENYDAANNTCGGKIYYIFYASNLSAYCIELSNGEKIENVVQNMFNVNNSISDNVNKYSSAIKGVLESWYSSNLLGLGDFIDVDAVFCNDRVITNSGGWSPTGTITSSLLFTYNDSPSKTTASLSCSNGTDRFSKSNSIAKLEYSIGLLTEAEQALMGSGYIRTGKSWWLASPMQLSNYSGQVRYVHVPGDGVYYYVSSSEGIRPAIVLKPGVEVLEGNGTYNNPYIIDALPTLSLIPGKDG